ncbi:MAG: hypothetical protein RLY70_890, partial [Planctomycetota bacterium]
MSIRNRKRGNSSRHPGRSWVRKVLDLFGGESAARSPKRVAGRRGGSNSLGPVFTTERLEDRRVMATLDYDAANGIVTLAMSRDDQFSMDVSGGKIRFVDTLDNSITLTGNASAFFDLFNTSGGGSTNETAVAKFDADIAGFRTIRVTGRDGSEALTIGDTNGVQFPGLFVEASVDATFFDTPVFETLDIATNSVIVHSPEIVLIQNLVIDTNNFSQEGDVMLDDPNTENDEINATTSGGQSLTISAGDGVVTLADIGEVTRLGSVVVNSASYVYFTGDIETDNGDVNIDADWEIVFQGDNNADVSTRGGDV